MRADKDAKEIRYFSTYLVNPHVSELVSAAEYLQPVVRLILLASLHCPQIRYVTGMPIYR